MAGREVERKRNRNALFEGARQAAIPRVGTAWQEGSMEGRNGSMIDFFGACSSNAEGITVSFSLFFFFFSL